MSDNKTEKHIEDSLNYIFTGKKLRIWISVISFVSSFYIILPIFALIGYLFNVRESAYNNKKIPNFENYQTLVEEGYYGLVTYSPLIFLIIFSSIFSFIYQPVALGVLSLVIFMWPIVSINYSLKRDYKSVYSPDIFNVIMSEAYIKYWMIYSLFNILFICVIITTSLVTFGLSFFILFPILLISRASYWGYTVHNIDEFTHN